MLTLISEITYQICLLPARVQELVIDLGGISQWRPAQLGVVHLPTSSHLLIVNKLLSLSGKYYLPLAPCSTRTQPHGASSGKLCYSVDGAEVPWTDDAEGSGHLNRGIRGIAPQGLD